MLGRRRHPFGIASAAMVLAPPPALGFVWGLRCTTVRLEDASLGGRMRASPRARARVRRAGLPTKVHA
eukprot:NODE_11146_length_288_cov_116.214592.p4 GENE.NODE_11146_length_288_cov_116.214592~~NODE_11146_length_288_cov_116.214592.p4  ORF type:complete len:68 (-),score=8.83 NODE_11146_length_288_cov_116.214592:28-231(-)